MTPSQNKKHYIYKINFRIPLELQIRKNVLIFVTS